VDKPLGLQAEKTMPKPTKPPSTNVAGGPVNIEDVPISPTPFATSHDAMLDSPRLECIEHPKVSLHRPSPMYSELPVDHNQARALPCLGREINCELTHMF
jgi:hypothetical protein